MPFTSSMVTPLFLFSPPPCGEGSGVGGGEWGTAPPQPPDPPPRPSPTRGEGEGSAAPRLPTGGEASLDQYHVAALDVGRQQHLNGLVLHLDDGQLAGHVHAGGAELPRAGEGVDIGGGERVTHLLLVGRAGAADGVLQHLDGGRAG